VYVKFATCLTTEAVGYARRYHAAVRVKPMTSHRRSESDDMSLQRNKTDCGVYSACTSAPDPICTQRYSTKDGLTLTAPAPSNTSSVAQTDGRRGQFMGGVDRDPMWL